MFLPGEEVEYDLADNYQQTESESGPIESFSELPLQIAWPRDLAKGVIHPFMSGDQNNSTLAAKEDEAEYNSHKNRKHEWFLSR
jgi:hypothetical protein